jgi:hypothetical protein
MPKLSKTIETHWKSILFTVILFASLLRFSGLSWGLTTSQYTWYFHNDERKMTTYAEQFPGNILTNRDLNQPTFVPYSGKLLAWGPVSLWRMWSVHIGSGKEIPLRYAYFIALRLYSAILGTLSVWITFLLARKVYDLPTALLSAVFLAISMLHVRNSHFTTVDIAMTFFVVLFIYGCVQLITEGASRWRYMLLGVVFGVVVGSKYSGAIAGISLLMAHLWVWRQSHSPKKFKAWLQIVDMNLLLTGLISFGTFLLTTPGAVVRFNDFLASLRFQMIRVNTGHYGMFVHPINGFTFQVDLLGQALGWPLAIVCLVGLIYVTITASVVQLPLLLFVWVSYVYLARWEVIFARYLMPVIPGLVILGARFLVVAYRQKMQSIKWLSALATALVVGYSLLYSLAYLNIFWEKHTRLVASEYIDRVLPGNSKVVGVKPFISNKDKFQLVTFQEKPDYVVLNYQGDARLLWAANSPFISPDYVWDPAHNNVWYPEDPPEPFTMKMTVEIWQGVNRDYVLQRKFSQVPHIDGWRLNLVQHRFDELAARTHPEIRIYRRLPQNALHVAFSETGINLVGSDVPSTVQPGDDLDIVLHWEFFKPVDREYKVFVHFRSSVGETVAQADDWLLSEEYLAYDLIPVNEVLLEHHHLILPSNVPAGSYHVLVGLYDPVTLVRFPVTDDATGENAVDLGVVQVE